LTLFNGSINREFCQNRYFCRLFRSENSQLGLKIVVGMDELMTGLSGPGVTAARFGEDKLWERYFT
jgi:hypothetical protein